MLYFKFKKVCMYKSDEINYTCITYFKEMLNWKLKIKIKVVLRALTLVLIINRLFY